MPLSIKDGAVWRNITAVSVNDAGTWRTIKNIWVNDAGTWRLVFSAYTLAFSPNTSFAADDSVAAAVTANSDAYFRLNNDGTTTILGNTTQSGPTKWIDPTGGTIGNDYEAQVEVTTITNTGSATQTYTVLGTNMPYNQATPYTSSWTALTSDRIVRAQASAAAVNPNPSCFAGLQGTVTVRRVGTTSPVTTVNFAITAEADAF